jgi:catechol 2,3-dioxygenase-like lactoylglutathione lyase family enzyme
MQIDHVELFVSDREEACRWYGEWLGFEAMPQHADWAASGPLMLTNDDGATMRALFGGEPQAIAQICGWRRVAFRVGGNAFLAWMERYRQSGQSLEGPVDHGRAWSGYFCDPWLNELEVTTYDYETVRSAEEATQ